MANNRIENLDHEGWFNYSYFYDWVVENNPDFTIFVELGVWSGRSITYLAQITRKRSVKVYAVDLFEDTYKWFKNDMKEITEDIYNIYNRQLERNGMRHRVTDIKNYSWDAAKQFEDKSVDFIFIDADHRYESVKKDIGAWLPKMKDGGIISGHDYTESIHEENGVSKAVKETFNNYQLFGDSVWWKRI